MTRIVQAAVRNRLLSALSPEDFKHLAGSLQPVELRLKQVLYSPGERIEAAWFPESGMISILTHLEGGESQELGVIGREGMAGLPLVLGSDVASTEAMSQMQGTVLRLPAGALREACAARPGVLKLLLRYVLAFHGQVSQTAACNNHHPIEERLARWLLLSHDRAEGDSFPMTHEFMALMLGVRRPGVTIAAGILQKAGVIAYDHGQMTVLDRRQLEAAACECYRSVQQEFAELLP
jgi:CRP-like cAMP-binding protein